MQDPPPAQAVDPTEIDWAVLRLKPPSEHELKLAHRVGLDPNILVKRFRKQYSAAIAADSAKINAIVGDDDSCGPVYQALWDYLNEFCTARHHEWWAEPLQNLAKVLNPAASIRDLDGIERTIHSTGRVGHTLTWTPARTACSRTATSWPRRQREHRPASTRRTSSSSTSSGSDPGDPEGPREGARLCAFRLDLISIDWPEALIDAAYAFSVEIEREMAR